MHFSIQFYNELKHRINYLTKNHTNTIVIAFKERTNAVDSNAEIFFTARKIVKLGMAKDAKVMERIVLVPSGIKLIPYGIEFAGVRKEKVEELLSYSKSMGAKRWGLQLKQKLISR